MVRGRLKAILIKYDGVKEQLGQVVGTLNLDSRIRAFSRCIECNQPLVAKEREEIQELVPPYVFQTQNQYMQCPTCRRIYWRGTHWDRMNSELGKLGQK